MMPVSQGNRNGRIIFLAGALTSLFGGIALFGWAFGFPLLTRVRPEWNPMVPGTALCFLLGGISLMKSGKSAGMLIWAMLLLSGARMVGLAFGRDFEFVEFLASIVAPKFRMAGHMSPETASGFLAFGIGMLALRADGRKARIAAWTAAAILLFLGSAVVLGYFLKLHDLYEAVYVETGLIWMSLPTAAGMTLLGAGLFFLMSIPRGSSAEAPAEVRIYRTTVFVVAFTSLATVLAGMKFLEEAIFRQSVSDMVQTLDSRRSYIDAAIDYRTRQIVMSSARAQLSGVEAAWFENPDVPLKGVDAELPANGFSGIALERGGRRIVLRGSLVPDAIQGIRLKGETDASLLWDNGYFLRMRLSAGVPGGFIVFELPLPRLNRTFEEAMHWGETGTMPMCGRLDAKRLLCFPQREQVAMYVVPDTFKGEPIPMTNALDDRSGIAILTDYRGRKVLSAYGPIGRTGLGLVLRMDVSEVYAPVRRELLFAFPLVSILIVLGLWLVRSRVKPLAEDLASAHAAEKRTSARFEAARESSPDAFVILESVKNGEGEIVDFRHVYVNSHAAEMTGMSADEMVGRSFLEYFPEQKEAFSEYRQVALSGKPAFSEFFLAGEVGEASWFQRQAVAMPEGVAVTFRNITQEKRLVGQLEYSNRLRTAIVESAAYSIISTDVDGTIITFNKAAERMLWYRAEEVTGKATLLRFHDEDEIRERAEALSQELDHEVPAGFEVFAAKPKRHFHEEHEWTYIRKDGSRFPVRLSVTPLQDERGVLQGFLGIAYDISEEKRMQEYIRHIALHDVLTGLPNRALLEDRVNMAIELQHRKNVPFALGMMDIDRFKHINDSMGHHIGDKLLREFVERVKSGMRPSDTLARMGGDEFVLLLSDTDEAGVAIVAE
ncbi:MAG TPA: PAS domain S-box protein, partial [Burkholderiales bacterium]|nr:PAS domain S-box protein [Burkholderiales bacterium]